MSLLCTKVLQIVILLIFPNPHQTLFQEFLFTSNADVAGFVFLTMIPTCAGTESHGSVKPLRPLSNLLFDLMCACMPI